MTKPTGVYTTAIGEDTTLVEIDFSQVAHRLYKGKLKFALKQSPTTQSPTTDGHNQSVIFDYRLIQQFEQQSKEVA